MKIVFDEKAGYEFFALNDMAKIDDNAKKLLKRLSVILVDMMQKPGINDSELGKVEHYPGVEKGYLGGKLSGCIVRNIDTANRIVACEINGTAVILSCMGHYNDPMLHPTSLNAVQGDLIEVVKENPQVLSDLEESSSYIIELVRYEGCSVTGIDKESYDKLVAEFNKKTKGPIGRIFPTDINYVKGMIPDSPKELSDEQRDEVAKKELKTINHAIEHEYFRTIYNAVNYSICYALEESGHDLRKLLENKRKYDRLIHLCMYDIAFKINNSATSYADKDCAIRRILYGYANAYVNHITLTDEKDKTKKYPNNLIFMDRFNGKLSEIINNDVHINTKLYRPDKSTVNLTDMFEYENAVSGQNKSINSHKVNFSGIAKILALNFDGTDPERFYSDLKELKISRLTRCEVKRIRLQLEMEKREREREQEQERAMALERARNEKKVAYRGR